MKKWIIAVCIIFLIIPFAQAWSWNWGTSSKQSSNSQSNYVKHNEKKCYGSSVYWFDNKNVRNDLVQKCSQGCSNGNCVTNTPPSNSKPANTATTSKKYTANYPIIFVHGWNGNYLTFSDMQDKLDSEKIVEDKGDFSSSSMCSGWSKAISVNFEYYANGKDNGISYYADLLSQVVNTIKSCTGSSKVTIIAHSMGGLISREYMKKYGDSSVNKLIMLETPNYGSPLASKSSSSDAKQMIPRSSFLKSINSNKNECRYRSKMVNIASRVLLEGFFDDEVEKQASGDVCQGPPPMSIVAPVVSTKLNKAQNIEISGCGHSDSSGIIDLTDIAINSPSCSMAYSNVKRYIS